MENNYSKTILDALDCYKDTVTELVEKAPDRQTEIFMKAELEDIWSAIEHVTNWSNTINGLGE